MSQYSPIPSLQDHPLLGRRITKEEYERVVNFALDLGFDELFVQAVDERTLSPDFAKENPFDW
jgi:putative pyruvate formate lyase activating enzyme